MLAQRVAGDIRDAFSEAKNEGFDVKAIREILKIRKLDAAVREEQETVIEVYKCALGMDSNLGGNRSRGIPELCSSLAGVCIG